MAPAAALATASPSADQGVLAAAVPIVTADTGEPLIHITHCTFRC